MEGGHTKLSTQIIINARLVVNRARATFIDIGGTKAFVGWQTSSIIPACYPLNVIIHGRSSSQQWKSYERTPIQARAALNRTKTTKSGFIEWKFFFPRRENVKPRKAVPESARARWQRRGESVESVFSGSSDIFQRKARKNKVMYGMGRKKWWTKAKMKRLKCENRESWSWKVAPKLASTGHKARKLARSVEGFKVSSARRKAVSEKQNFHPCGEKMRKWKNFSMKS